MSHTLDHFYFSQQHILDGVHFVFELLFLCLLFAAHLQLLLISPQSLTFLLFSLIKMNPKGLGVDWPCPGFIPASPPVVCSDRHQNTNTRREMCIDRNCNSILGSKLSCLENVWCSAPATHSYNFHHLRSFLLSGCNKRSR